VPGARAKSPNRRARLVARVRSWSKAAGTSQSKKLKKAKTWSKELEQGAGARSWNQELELEQKSWIEG